MISVRLGQLWEIHFQGVNRWFPGSVTDIDGEFVTLRSQNYQWHRCHVDDMQDRARYRLVADWPTGP